MTLVAALGWIAAVVWGAVLALPWQPWRNRERLEADLTTADDLADVQVLIPARDEANVIDRTIRALGRQGRGLHVLVVDDQSADGTGETAMRAAREPSSNGFEVEVLQGAPLPTGWAGKLWALEQGLQRVSRPYVLLLDADIELAPHMLPTLLRAVRERGAALVSIMAELSCTTFWERLLVPPFIFFFKLLYPFALANDPQSRAAAAAGGCMLVNVAALREAGGFTAIRNAIIDDCSLAARLKAADRSTWVGLSHSVRSLRVYATLAEFWRMVSRSAFTQLRYSLLLLALTTLLMAVLFAGPIVAVVAGVAAGRAGVVLLGVVAIAAMGLAYLPTARFYARPAAWVITLPAAAVLYLAMTWSSAVAYWRGTRATWKNRRYAATE